MTSGDKYQPPSDEPTCPADIRGILAGMEQLMADDPSFNNGGVPTQIALDLIRTDRVTSFAQFEGWLREMDSKVHFIAVPLNYFGEEWAGSTISPLEDTDEPQYTLWVGVNGAEEAKEKYAELGTYPEDNMHRLLTTGVLSVA